MKYLRELTLPDLDEHPIWEHLGGSDDVATVLPRADFHDPDTRGYVAKTQFEAARGDTFVGFCSPQGDSGLDYIQPVIIVGSRQINLWDESAGEATDSKSIANALGLTTTEVFPLRYRCLVPFEGEYLEDVVDAAS